MHQLAYHIAHYVLFINCVQNVYTALSFLSSFNIIVAILMFTLSIECIVMY